MPIGTRSSSFGGVSTRSSGPPAPLRTLIPRATPRHVSGRATGGSRNRGNISGNSSGGSDSNNDGSGSNRTIGRTRSAPDDERSGGPVAEVTRLMKRMRVEELRDICKAASALEKAKLEDRKKVEAFLAKNEDFSSLVEDCYICLEPLLSNIGTPKFGVISWHCRCTVAQKAHSACIFSKINRGKAKCDMCSSPMMFENSRRRGSKATLLFYREGKDVEGDRDEESHERESVSDVEDPLDDSTEDILFGEFSSSEDGDVASELGEIEEEAEDDDVLEEDGEEDGDRNVLLDEGRFMERAAWQVSSRSSRR